MARRSHPTKLPAPYLKRISVRSDALPLPKTYPFDLPWLDNDFGFEFDQPVTIFCGKNGVGKPTLIEARAAVCGFSDSGGNRSVAGAPNGNHDEMNGAALSFAMRGSWLLTA